MGKHRVIVCALLALAGTAAAQSITLPSLVRKGAIETLAVEPTEPTTASTVVLRATVVDALNLIRAETQRIGTTFMVKIYWSESATGGMYSQAGLCRETLGKLAKGTYFAIVQSFCDGRLAGSKQLSFKVVEAPEPTMQKVIYDVWVTPQNPTTSDNTVVNVYGKWPTEGYSQPISMARLSGQTGTVDLYWEAPQGPVDPGEASFYYDVPLKMALAGTYTIRVRVYLDGRLVDWEDISVEVTEGSGGSSWPWDPFFWGIDLP